MGDAQTVSLEQYLRVLRNRWPVIVATTVLGAVVAACYLFLAPTSYSATAAVQVNVITSDPFQASQSASNLIDGSTEASVARSFTVAALAADKFDAQRTPNEIREATEVTLITDATVLEITYTASTATNAQEGADALASAYLEYRQTQANAQLSGMREMIDEQLTHLREDLVEANAQAAAAEENSSEANQAASDRELITIEINSLITRKNVLESIDTTGGVVLTPARENPIEASPSKRLVAASGVLGGLLIGIVLAFVMHVADRRVGNAVTISKATGIRALSDLPDARTELPPRSDGLEALRMLRERVLLYLPADARTLTITDVSAATHPADLATGLALVFAQEQRAVEVVLPALDDAQRKHMVDALHLEEVALDDKAAGERPRAQLRAYRTSQVRNLTIVIGDRGNGLSEPDPVLTHAVRERLSDKTFDGLRILSLQGSSTAPSQLAAQRYSDAVVLVATRGVTRDSAINDSLTASASADTVVLGVITVPAARSGDARTATHAASVRQ